MVSPSFSQARGRGGAPVRSRAGRDSPWRRLSAARAAAPTAPGRTRSARSPAAASFRTVGSPSREPAAPASPEPRARLGIRLGILRPHFRLGLRVTVRAGSAARKPPPRKRFRVQRPAAAAAPGLHGSLGVFPGKSWRAPHPQGAGHAGLVRQAGGAPSPGTAEAARVLCVETWPGETESGDRKPTRGGGSRLGPWASARPCGPCASRTQPPGWLPKVAVSCPRGCGFH